jgi:lysophospholipase L1-like esterase
VVDVGDDPRWKPIYYRDGIHFSVEGNRVLLKIIAEALEGNFASELKAQS